ncbi:MAG: response regulator transcription factor [Allosphingosinicella sp.]
MEKRWVYVVDDEEPIRRSLRLMLATRGYQVTMFESGSSLLNVWDALLPGCILLDIRMPEMDGLDVQKKLNAEDASLPIVFMTGHGDIAIAASALRSGAAAFVEKPFSKASVIEALAIAFLKLEDPVGYDEHLASAVRAVGRLTPGEMAVLEGMTAGCSSEAIAAEMGASGAEIDVLRARLFSSLGVGSVADALRIGFAAGLGLSTPA